ncbi:hypothetical protein O209_13845 [Lactiplantibacillus plantarum WHE 92]|nr:hypothetical protein O209_13845 [Lactiplantibacillus plantarum WHE 92]
MGRKVKALASMNKHLTNDERDERKELKKRYLIIRCLI